ncbi:MAG: pentapeptide repeat-containing protein, partial [Pseudomonadota bacterium]
MAFSLRQSPFAILLALAALLSASTVFAGANPDNCPYCTFQAKDLSGKNFAHANLRGATFAGLNLSGLDFSGANLAGADLSNTNLSGTIFNHADLSNARLHAAVLTGAKLNGTDLEYADLAGANVTGTDLSLAVLGPKPVTGIVQDATLEMTCAPANLTSVKHAAYVDSAGSDSPSCGATLASACKSIDKGIAYCKDKESCSVLVAFGRYPQSSPLALHDGVNLYGGCVKPGAGAAHLYSLIMAPANGAPAITANNIGKPTIVQNFKLDASAATAPGSASLGLQVANSAGLQLTDSHIYGGQGARGANGQAPGEAGIGGAASGATGGINKSCANSNGGDGSGNMDIRTETWTSGGPNPPGTIPIVYSKDAMACAKNDCNGYAGQPGSTGVSAKGGAHGDPNMGSCAYYRGGNGKPGDAGQPAACGAKGTRSANLQGTLVNGIWTAALAGTGINGGDGGGGGAGGAGGATGGWCVVVTRNYHGSSGGGGGAGGCGGAGGGGAQQGGASFGILNLAGALTVNNSKISAGRSGDGGTGWGAAKGALGGAGAAGLDGSDSGYGAAGGDGGGGGGGGGGAACCGNGAIGGAGSTGAVTGSACQTWAHFEQRTFRP